MTSYLTIRSYMTFKDHTGRKWVTQFFAVNSSEGFATGDDLFNPNFSSGFIFGER